jgi:hypothetical protein
MELGAFQTARLEVLRGGGGMSVSLQVVDELGNVKISGHQDSALV